MSDPAVPDPLRPHRHDPNPEPPTAAKTLRVVGPAGRELPMAPADLRRLPRTTIPRYAIVSTGHGTSGPFSFGGVTLLDLLQGLDLLPAGPFQLEIISADGFGNRVEGEEVVAGTAAGPILLSDELDGRPMTRGEGAVRLIVPSETDDALRQVKWVETVRIVLLPD
jgi:hypothetical protein